MFMPPSACPVKPREKVFDHAQGAEGVAAIRMGDSHGMCAEREGLMSEDTCVRR